MKDAKQFFEARFDTLLPAVSRWVAEHIVSPVLMIVRSKAPPVYKALAKKAQEDPVGFEAGLHLGTMGFDWLVDLAVKRLGISFPEGSTAETLAETIMGSIPRALKDALKSVDLKELGVVEEVPFEDAAAHLKTTMEQYFVKLKKYPMLIVGAIKRFWDEPVSEGPVAELQRELEADNEGIIQDILAGGDSIDEILLNAALNGEDPWKLIPGILAQEEKRDGN